MLVSLSSVLGARRPMTYQVSANGIRVRAVNEADEPLSDAKKRAANAVKAAADRTAAQKSAQEKQKKAIEKKRKETAKASVAKARNRSAELKKRRADAGKTKEASTGKPDVGADRAGKVNAQLAHCMVALHFKRGKDARGAWNICRASLTKHGYLKGPYREGGKLADLKPTQKGTRRAMQHAFEKEPLGGGIRGTPHEKYAKFRNLFRDIEPDL